MLCCVVWYGGMWGVRAHAAVVFDGQLIVFGGANGVVAFGDVTLISVDHLMARYAAERLGGGSLS